MQIREEVNRKIVYRRNKFMLREVACDLKKSKGALSVPPCFLLYILFNFLSEVIEADIFISNTQ